MAANHLLSLTLSESHVDTYKDTHDLPKENNVSNSNQLDSKSKSSIKINEAALRQISQPNSVSTNRTFTLSLSETPRSVEKLGAKGKLLSSGFHSAMSKVYSENSQNSATYSEDNERPSTPKNSDAFVLTDNGIQYVEPKRVLTFEEELRLSVAEKWRNHSERMHNLKLTSVNRGLVFTDNSPRSGAHKHVYRGHHVGGSDPADFLIGENLKASALSFAKEASPRSFEAQLSLLRNALFNSISQSDSSDSGFDSIFNQRAQIPFGEPPRSSSTLDDEYKKITSLRLDSPYLSIPTAAILDETGRVECMVTPFVDQDFSEFISQANPSEDFAMVMVTILIDVARGLEYLHSRNLVHQDVKPANVLLPFNKEVSAILCDLEGVCDELDNRAKTVHTPRFYDPASHKMSSGDMYALGECMFDVVKRISKSDCADCQFREKIVSELAQLGRKLKNGNFCARPTASQVIEELTKLQESLTVSLSPTVPVERSASAPPQIITTTS